MPARSTALSKAPPIPSGLVPVRSRKTRAVLSLRTLACWARTAQLFPVRGAERVPPFLVSRKVSIFRFRSTSDQRRVSNSPLLAPVDNAKTTTVQQFPEVDKSQ